jgi:Beta-glucan synthesis-associated protein SKN1/KRE6/Sbg1
MFCILIYRQGSLVPGLAIHFIFSLTLNPIFDNPRNKFCFTGGYIETSVQLPGTNNVVGMWPAVWTAGNLGRAGYGATLEGMVGSKVTHYKWHIANIFSTVAIHV